MLTTVTGCKKCVEFCRFHALMYIREKPMVFSEVCHSCGGCQIGLSGTCRYRKGKAYRKAGNREGRRALKTVTGILNPGEASGSSGYSGSALKQAGGADDY